VETIRYKVAVNHEEQYALWMCNKENAAGWRDTGIAGTKSECLDYIRSVWTDMRPLSLRKAMTGGNVFGNERAASRLRQAA
jgi:MbtH protein